MGSIIRIVASFPQPENVEPCMLGDSLEGRMLWRTCFERGEK